MSDIKRNIAAFEAQFEALKARHDGQWVVFHDGQLVGGHDSFHDAASFAVERFDPGTFLIRRVAVARTFDLSPTILFGLGRAV